MAKNDEMNDIHLVLWSINYDIEEGTLLEFTQEKFHNLKEELEIGYERGNTIPSLFVNTIYQENRNENPLRII